MHKRFDFTQIVIYRLEDGRIAEVWKAGDLLSMMEQIGDPAPRHEALRGLHASDADRGEDGHGAAQTKKQAKAPHAPVA